MLKAQEQRPVPLTLVLVGGSHLGTAGLSPTSNFAVLLSRSLRSSLGSSFDRTRSVFCEGDPLQYLDALPDPLAEGTVPVLLPRNLALVPMLGELRHAAARVRGGRPLEFRSVFTTHESRLGEAVRRLRLVVRYVAGTAWAAVNLVLLPRRLRSYGRGIDHVLDRLRAQGVRHVLLTTPIPLRGRDFPLSRLYQAAFAMLLRARRGPNVAVVDLFAMLSVERHAFLQPEDPLHLSAEGHRRVAAALAETVLDRLSHGAG